MSDIKIPNEVWCRTCGYYRPVKQMSIGKQSEFNDRVNYKIPLNLNAQISNKKKEIEKVLLMEEVK